MSIERNIFLLSDKTSSFFLTFWNILYKTGLDSRSRESIDYWDLRSQESGKGDRLLTQSFHFRFPRFLSVWKFVMTKESGVCGFFWMSESEKQGSQKFGQLTRKPWYKISCTSIFACCPYYFFIYLLFWINQFTMTYDIFDSIPSKKYFGTKELGNIFIDWRLNQVITFYYITSKFGIFPSNDMQSHF